MTFHVEIIELSQKTDDGFLAQRLPDTYPTLDAARAAGEGYVNRRDPKFGQATFRVVDQNGDPVEPGSPGIVSQ